MAKTIKFNLICDGKPIRTLEDLRGNFSMEDVLNYYHNGHLKKWLSVRGYEKERDAVDKISLIDEFKILNELIEIFDLEAEEEEIEEFIYLMNYQKENMKKVETHKKNNFQVASIIKEYHVNYNELVTTIIENKNDMLKIKSAVKEIILNHYGLFLLNYKELYDGLIDKAPQGIFAMLMNEKMRRYYLLEENENSEQKTEMLKTLIEIVNDMKITDVLGNSLCVFAGNTNNDWKSIETKGKKYMILKMELGNFIRPAEQNDVELKTEDVNGRFLIIDGIDYRSNLSSQKLLYMEV